MERLGEFPYFDGIYCNHDRSVNCTLQIPVLQDNPRLVDYFISHAAFHILFSIFGVKLNDIY